MTGGDKPGTIHLRAAEEKQNGFCQYIVADKVTLWSASYSAVWYILKQLFTSVSVKVEDSNLLAANCGFCYRS